MQYTQNPAKLTQAQKENPWLFIRDFFITATADEHKMQLWHWLQATVSGTYPSPYMTKEQRFALLQHYQQMEKLVEAAHLIFKRHKNNRNRKWFRNQLRKNTSQVPF